MRSSEKSQTDEVSFSSTLCFLLDVVIVHVDVVDQSTFRHDKYIVSRAQRAQIANIIRRQENIKGTAKQEGFLVYSAAAVSRPSPRCEAKIWS